MIAMAHVLNKLGNDSELIVMNAAGMPPWRVFRPFFAAALVVSLLVAVIAVYISPKCLRDLRTWSTHVRTDIVTNSLQPGRFLVLDGNLTLHIRDRRPNGQLVGIMVDDQRDRKERMTILAPYGDILVNERGTYLVLEKGTVQRQETGQRDPTFVRFDQHAFDLSRLSFSSQGLRYSVQERFFWELYSPPPGDSLYAEQPGQFRAELHNRLVAPLYPLAFLVVTFAYLGAPRTTRQSRNFSMSSAILAVFGLRMAGFACSVMAVKSPLAPIVQYLMLTVAIGASLWIILGGIVVEPPAALMEAINKSSARLLRLFGRPATA